MSNAENFSELIQLISWGIFACVFLFFTVISIILNYHWTKYGVHPRRLKLVKTIYFGVSAILLITMAMFLLSIKS